MKKHFFTGLVILLPIVITIAVVDFFIHLFADPFVDLITNFFKKMHLFSNTSLFYSNSQIIQYLSKLVVLVMLFFLIVGLGIITRWFLFRALLNLSDRILHKIPIFNVIYKATQEIAKTVFKSDTMIFKQVVIAPFLQKDMYAVGLVSQEFSSLGAHLPDKDTVTVLIPTTPNPTTGFLVLYKKSDLIYTDMKPEEALKYVVSCGVLVPERDILGKKINNVL